MLYFDHAASTPLNKVGLDVLKESLENDFANPSASHKLGKALLKRIESARETFLKLVDAKDFDFVFTSSATESNNTIIKGLKLTDDSNVLGSSGDHASIKKPITDLGRFEFAELPLQVSGEIDYALLDQMELHNFSLVVVAHVNNHTGNIQDVEKIAEIVKSKSPKAHIHVDGVQAFGKIDFSLKNSRIDSYTISGHKIGATKGISGLYIRRGVVLDTLLSGGGHEGGRRSSTLFAPLIFSFEATAKDVYQKREESYSIVEKHYTKVKDAISGAIPTAKFVFSNVSPYILTFIIPKISSDIVMRYLERDEIYVASSSACSSKVKGFSPVYQALHLPESEHKNVLRVSFSYIQSDDEIDAFINKFKACIDGLKFLIK